MKQPIEFTTAIDHGKSLQMYSVYQIDGDLIVFTKVEYPKPEEDSVAEIGAICTVSCIIETQASSLLPIRDFYCIDERKTPVAPGSYVPSSFRIKGFSNTHIVGSEYDTILPPEAICLFGKDFVTHEVMVAASSEGFFARSSDTLITISITEEFGSNTRSTALGDFIVVDIHSLDPRITRIHQICGSEITLKIPALHAADIIEKLKKHGSVAMVNGEKTLAGCEEERKYANRVTTDV